MLKKTSKQNKIGDVRYIHGFVQLGSVKLNVLCYEIDGVIIDTGAQTLLEDFKSFFTESDADQVVITHFHEDHTGGAAYLQKTYGLPIYMNEMSINSCAKEASYPFYRKLFWGKRESFQAEKLGDTFISRNATWKVIPTPGHAVDHLAFLNQETGQLFSGDLYVHPRTKVVLREESIPTIINSIERVLTYDFEEMFCCHAGYVDNGPKAFRNKLQYLQDLQGNVLASYHKGHSIKEIQKSIFKKTYPITYFSLGEWDSKHIITSIIEADKTAQAIN